LEIIKKYGVEKAKELNTFAQVKIRFLRWEEIDSKLDEIENDGKEMRFQKTAIIREIYQKLNMPYNYTDDVFVRSREAILQELKSRSDDYTAKLTILNKNSSRSKKVLRELKVKDTTIATAICNRAIESCAEATRLTNEVLAPEAIEQQNRFEALEVERQVLGGELRPLVRNLVEQGNIMIRMHAEFNNINKCIDEYSKKTSNNLKSYQGLRKDFEGLNDVMKASVLAWKNSLMEIVKHKEPT